MIRYLTKDNLHLILLSFIAFFPILPMGLISAFILGFTMVSFYFFIKQPFIKSHISRNVKWFFITTAFYLWIIIAILYSSEIGNGIKKLQSSLSLLIIPLSIFIFIRRISDKTIELIHKCFVFANILLVLFIHFYFFKCGVYGEFKSATFWDSPVRDTLAENNFKDLHPTYISLWFLYCVLYILDVIVKEHRDLMKSYIFFMVLTQITFLSTAVLLSARISMIAFILALIVYILLSVKDKIYRYGSIIFIVLVLLISVFNISYLKSRLIDEFKVTELSPPIGNSHNSVNIRVGIYECSVEVLKSDWLFGVGYGNVQQKLNTCYNKFNTEVYKRTTFNTHNQYLHIFISSGLMGITLFLVLLFKQLKLALLHRDFLFVVFTVLMFVSFLTENILVRIHGVLFYTVFNTLYVKKWIQERET